MWAKQLKIICLLIAGFMGLVSTVIPHHHDEQGAVCLHLADTHHQERHNDGDAQAPCCDDNRMNTTRTSTVDIVDLLRVVPVRTTACAWDLAIFSLFGDEPTFSDYGIYIERLHSVAYLQALSLRAPPVA